jgi:hypothetical protein
MPSATVEAKASSGRKIASKIASCLQSAVFRIAVYVVAFAVVTLAWRHYGLLTPSGVFLGPSVTQLTPIQKSELDAYQEMNNLITTLTTGLLGGVGYILTSGKRVSRSSGTKWLALGSASFAALSLFLGYFVYEVLIGMLDDGLFNLNIPLLLYPSFAHFFSFLLAVVLFGEFAFHAFFTEDGNVRKFDAPGK